MHNCEMSHLILVADDDPDIRMILRTILESAGYAVILAIDGNDALAQLRGGVLPDLAVLDIAMPGCDGNAVCQAIRSIPFYGPTVSVIMVSAREGVEDKLRSLDGGADDYITKPFNNQELLARVRSALRAHDLSVELQSTRAQLIEQERTQAVTELAGSAAHALNQPLASLKLNLHLLDILQPSDERFLAAKDAIKGDVERLADLIVRLQGAAKSKRRDYHDGKKIMDL